MKIVSVIIFLCCLSCTSQIKKAKPVTLESYFPLKKKCSWIYKLKTDEPGQKYNGDFLVRTLMISEEQTAISFGGRTEFYRIENNSIYNIARKYAIIKTPLKHKKWQITDGVAEIIHLEKKIHVPAGTFNALVIKETFEGKNYYTISYYAPYTGLIILEVYDHLSETPVTKMTLKTVICE